MTQDTKPKKKADVIDSEEEVVFTSLRATSWDEFCGQATVKKSLQIAIAAAQNRSEAIEHVLLYGPPGLGKTSLSHLIAREMNSNIRMTSGPAIVRVGDLAAILTNLEKGDVLFIDEIHRLNTAVEETLYSAMEDYALDVIMGKGPSARTLRLDLPQFTVIGATTRVGMLSAPLRDRFGVIHHLTFYNPSELSVIIKKAAKKLTIGIDDDAVGELAKRARGTPRIALRLLKRARDYASVHEKTTVNCDVVIDALDLIEIDPLGLDPIDRHYLNAVINKHGGGPVGVETIAASISEDVETIEEVVEPYLMQIGFIKRSPRGRVATDASYYHLGINLPKERVSEK